MDFTLTESQEELQGLTRQILEDRMTLAHLKARDFSDDWYDRDTWSEFAKANLLGVAFPESAGGLGFGFLELCFVLREIGRNVAPLPAIPTLVAGGAPDRPLRDRRAAGGARQGRLRRRAPHRRARRARRRPRVTRRRPRRARATAGASTA